MEETSPEARIVTVAILETGSSRQGDTTNEVLYQEMLKGTSSHSLA